MDIDISFFLNHFRGSYRIGYPFYSQILQHVFPKNKDILLQNHCTIIKTKKLTLLTVTV